MSKSKGRDSWKARVHPAFLKIGKLWSEFHKADLSSEANAGRRKAQELRAEAVRLREELPKLYPDLRPGSSSNHILAASKSLLSEQDARAGALEWLCWRRAQQPLAVLLAEEGEGSHVAHDTVQRVRDDFWRAVHGESVEPFKTNAYHWELLEIGLDLRLTELSAEELAACFDELCPCGETHDASALRKLRLRVSKQLIVARVRSLRRIPQQQRFAAYGANGLTAKAYESPRKKIRYVEVSRHGGQTECVIYADDVITVDTSPLNEPSGMCLLLEAFGVKAAAQLFAMFFPEEHENA